MDHQGQKRSKTRRQEVQGPSKAAKTEDRIISLNVGGKIYATSHSTLTKYPDSMLGKMVGGDLPSKKDAQGNYVIDRDGKLFRYVLTFLRSSKLTLPENFQELDMLAEEAEFYQITDLIEAVKICQKKISDRVTTSQDKEVYMLNVGGTLYPVLRKYLERDEQTPTINYGDSNQLNWYNNKRPFVLGNLWEKITSPDAPKDNQGNFIIDGDPVLFRYILNFVRTRRFHLPADFSEFDLLQCEIDQLQLQSGFNLVSYLEGQLRNALPKSTDQNIHKKWIHYDYKYKSN